MTGLKGGASQREEKPPWMAGEGKNSGLERAPECGAIAHEYPGLVFSYHGKPIANYYIRDRFRFGLDRLGIDHEARRLFRHSCGKRPGVRPRHGRRGKPRAKQAGLNQNRDRAAFHRERRQRYRYRGSRPLASGKRQGGCLDAPALSGHHHRDLARYSAMTVLDRLNESLVLAEQELSASGNYSDDDYIAMGRLTNAKYIVAGAIQRLSGRYSVSFRINDTETNAIRASFNKQYGAEDIESGLAAKETVREVLAGLGVELTHEGERQLLAVQQVPVRAQVNRARGMAAEKTRTTISRHRPSIYRRWRRTPP
jgi:hypothetical protein